MNNDVFGDIALEQTAKEKFGVAVDISSVIVRGASVSRTAQATVFLTAKKQLYVYVTAQSNLLLGDIQKIIARMGLKAELYLPPRGRTDYFDQIGRKKFNEVFPGRNIVAKQDILFYRTLAPYNPALILIEEVKNGEIRGYDSDASTGWRTLVKFAYRRIKTS